MTKIKESQILLYDSPEGEVRLEVFFQNETVWLTQKQISQLFEVERSVVTKHLKNLFNTKELIEKSNVQKMHIAKSDKPVKFYDLDVIISVGYRVSSKKATQFRIWATKTLREFIIKGFVLDDKRLKEGKIFGRDYFDELLEKIREIRASERRFYQKIADIYSLSANYDPSSDITKDFFATVQNKLHWAITGKTAAEIIYSLADSKEICMGLKTWKNFPKGKILKSDILVAKNYLNLEHIQELEQIISAYLDLAENRAKRKIIMKMEDWVIFLNKFLELSEYPILKNKGKVSKLKAELKAIGEYKKFRIKQDKSFESDFDKEVKKYLKKF